MRRADINASMIKMLDSLLLCIHTPAPASISAIGKLRWHSLGSQVSGVWMAYLVALDTGVRYAPDTMLQVWVANTDEH